MMRLLILDNYDSFTFNLVHLIEKVSPITFDVIKNDQLSISNVSKYDKILLSPGPGLPFEAGIMPQILKTYASSKSILGVCLGFQAIGECFNSPLKNLTTVFHGRATPITVLNNDILFKGLPKQFKVGRYHSWVLDENQLSDQLEVTAVDENGFIMAAQHRSFDVRGVQFHPESILSEYGEEILKNWLLLSKT